MAKVKKPFGRRLKKYAKNMITHHVPRRFMGSPYDISDVVHDVAQLRQLINTEFKYSYQIGTDVPLDNFSTPAIYLMNGLVQGTDADNRNGRSILVKSLQCALNVEMIGTETDTKFRFMVVIDKQPNGAVATVSQILQSTGTENSLMAPRNLNNRKRFVILKDQVMSLNEGVRRVGFIKYYRKLNMHTTYNSSDTGTITDIATNALYVILWSNKTTTGRPTLQINNNIRFLDN